TAPAPSTRTTATLRSPFGPSAVMTKLRPNTSAGVIRIDRITSGRRSSRNSSQRATGSQAGRGSGIDRHFLVDAGAALAHRAQVDLVERQPARLDSRDDRVLARDREQRTEIGAARQQRFEPQRVIGAGLELDPRTTDAGGDCTLHLVESECARAGPEME